MEVQALDSDPTAVSAAAVAPSAVAVAQPQNSAPALPASPSSAAPAASGAPSGTDTGKSALPKDVAEHSSLLSSVARTLAGATVSVSYRVDFQSHEVVTVFKDGSSGQVLFQIPAQILEQLASFFDQQSGAVIDRKA